MKLSLRRCGWALLLMAAFSSVANAQFDVHFSNYWALTGFYNPASSGNNKKLNILGTYSMQLLGYENAPQSMYFGADMPFRLFGKEHGVGAGFFNETIGLFKNQNFWAQYAYRQKLGNSYLAAGFKIGALTVGFDPTDIRFYDEEVSDPAFPTAEEDGMAVDLGAGIFYSHPWIWAGVSATHLTMPTIKLGDNYEFRVSPMFYFVCGGNIKTKNPLISIQPSFQMQTDFVAYRYDISSRFTYTFGEKDLYVGLSYSPKTSVSFLVGGKIKDFSLGYVFDMYTSKIGAGSGSHDIVLSYSMDLKFAKKGKNKHKSIRIL